MSCGPQHNPVQSPPLTQRDGPYVTSTTLPLSRCQFASLRVGLATGLGFFSHKDVRSISGTTRM